jgi:HK97 family phage portal protein
MQISAFSACVDILSSDIGGLPFIVQRNGKPDPSHPLYDILHTSNCPDMTSQNFREVQVQDLIIYGNCFAYIEKDDRTQRVKNIWPLPAYMTTPQKVNGVVYYYVQGVDQPLTADQVIHIPGLAWDGIRGKSIIEAHANTLGIALAQDDAASKMFRNGLLANGYLSYKGKLSEETKAALRAAWHERNCGMENAWNTPVLSEGMEFKPTGIPPEEAEFLASRKYSAIEICRLPGLRIPPHMISELDRATWANLEWQRADYVQYSLRRYILKFEHEYNRKLLLEDEKGVVACRMLVDDLMRGDQGTRYANYATAIQWGWLTPKSVAEYEGLDSDGLSDEALTPLNMSPVPSTTTPIKNSLPLSGGPTRQSVASSHLPGAVLEVPDIRQQDDYSCGACAAMCVGRFFGVGPTTLDAWKRALGTDVEQSTSPTAIVNYLSSLGLTVEAQQGMTIDDLAACIAGGRPVICPVQDYGSQRAPGASFAYGHYLTVIGIIPGYVICQDSSIENDERKPGGDVPPGQGDPSQNLEAHGRVLIRQDDFFKAWHDRDSANNQYDQYGIAVGGINQFSTTKLKKENNQTKEQKREKYRVLVEDAACRVITKERNAISRIAKNNLNHDVPTFEQNCGDFWETHSDTVSKTFRPVVSTYKEKKADAIIGKIVDDMRNESLDALAKAVQCEDPLEAVGSLLAGWGDMSRPQRISQKFCRGKYG